MSQQEVPPPQTDQQLNDLFAVVFQCEDSERRLDKILGYPQTGPPKCETYRPLMDTTYVPSFMFFDEARNRGISVTRAQCPHCHHTLFSNAGDNAIVKCCFRTCGGIMTWKGG